MVTNSRSLSEEEIQKIASKTGISVKEVKEVYDKYFSIIRDFMALKTCPTINTKYFKIQPSLSWIKKQLNYYFKKPKENREESKEFVTERLKRFWLVRDRIMQEERKDENKKVTNPIWEQIERELVRRPKEFLMDTVQALMKRGRL